MPERTAACGGEVGDHLLRATKSHPLGELDCPHCGSRVARLEPAAWRPWMQAMFLVLGVSGVMGLARAWPDGTWWPYAVVAAASALGGGWVRRRPDRILLPVADR
jgi:hypothetical protein